MRAYRLSRVGGSFLI